jgi:hypothetical protein
VDEDDEDEDYDEEEDDADLEDAEDYYGEEDVEEHGLALDDKGNNFIFTLISAFSQ